MKAKVRASQRTTVLHLAWVAVNRKDGSVITGHCKCMAGYVVCFYCLVIIIVNRWGEVCSHIAAILFKVEACIRLKIADVSCTSLPCAWNQSYSEKVIVMYSCANKYYTGRQMQVLSLILTLKNQ